MDATGSALTVNVGDAARGRILAHGKAQCLKCHRINDEGGRSGPDPSAVGSSRSSASLHLSLIEPSKAMLPINRPIRAVTKAGEIMTGRRLNEDTWNGRPAKLMLWANRNGFFYVLDRATGAFLFGKPFVKVNWASGLDDRGRFRLRRRRARRSGLACRVEQLVLTLVQPAHRSVLHSDVGELRLPDPSTGGEIRARWTRVHGRRLDGGDADAPGTPALRRGAFNLWTEATGTGAVIALDPATGEPRWKFEMTDVTDSGILTTATDLLFTGGREGYFQALDVRTGKLLWKTNLGGQIVNGPISYEVDGKQYVATIAGLNLVAFALRD
jgi:hypothetical protein